MQKENWSLNHFFCLGRLVVYLHYMVFMFILTYIKSSKGLDQKIFLIEPPDNIYFRDIAKLHFMHLFCLPKKVRFFWNRSQDMSSSGPAKKQASDWLTYLVYQLEVCFLAGNHLNSCPQYLRKKLTLSEIYTDLMIDSCWDFNFYENAFASEIPGSILFNFLIYSWDCCDSLIPIQYINFFACLYLWFELCQKQLCIGMST